MGPKLKAMDYSVAGLTLAQLHVGGTTIYAEDKVLPLPHGVAWNDPNRPQTGQPLPAFAQHLTWEPSFNVIFRLGLNDAWAPPESDPAKNATARAEFKARLTQMVQDVRNAGKRPIIGGLNRIAVTSVLQPFTTSGRISQRDDFDAAAHEVANETRTFFIDVGSVQFNGASDIVDDVHATQSYSDRIAAYINQQLNSYRIGEPVPVNQDFRVGSHYYYANQAKVYCMYTTLASFTSLTGKTGDQGVVVLNSLPTGFTRDIDCHH
jgi:hypothetical protein